MKIERLTITNFKAIDKLDFKPKMINLVVGRNNTGKTSLLEAINCVFNDEKIGKYYNRHLSKLIRVGSQESEILIKSEKGVTHLRLRKPDAQMINVSFKKELIKNLSQIEKFRKDVKFTEEIKNELEKVLNTLITQEIVSELLNESVTVIKDEKENTYFSFRTEKIMDFLQNVSEPISKHLKETLKLNVDSTTINVLTMRLIYDFVTDEYNQSERPIILIKKLKKDGKEKITEEEAVKIHEIDKYIRKHQLLKNIEKFSLDYLLFKHGGKIDSVPYDLMGDGFKAMVGFLWYLLSKDTNNKIVLLEEPEAYLHPGYVKELLDLIINFSKNMNIQFFITTHNIDFIESFFDEDLPKEEKDYLKEELFILRMETVKDHITSEGLDYKNALSTKKDILTDLRGI